MRTELDDDPDLCRSPGPSAAKPGAEVTTERHQIRFDSSTGNDEVIDAELAELGTSTADAVVPSEPRPRPVTAYNFRRLARFPEALKQSLGKVRAPAKPPSLSISTNRINGK